MTGSGQPNRQPSENQPEGTTGESVGGKGRAVGEAQPGDLVCARCGGRRVAGQFALPILGSAKFAVRLGPLAVETDIVCSVCLKCGLVDLGVADLERIHKAIRAEDIVKQTGRRLHR